MESSQEYFQLCLTVSQMADSIILKLGYLTRTTLAILSIIAMWIIVRIRGNYMRFHVNARLLFDAYVAWNFIMSISFLLINATDCIRFVIRFLQNSRMEDYHETERAGRKKGGGEAILMSIVSASGEHERKSRMNRHRRGKDKASAP